MVDTRSVTGPTVFHVDTGLVFGQWDPECGVESSDRVFPVGFPQYSVLSLRVQGVQPHVRDRVGDTAPSHLSDLFGESASSKSKDPLHVFDLCLSQ